MSMGIYYQADRETMLSETEKAEINKITRQYWEEYSDKDKFEGPGTFSNGDGQVYSGMIRIPLIWEENGWRFMTDEEYGEIG